MTSIIQLEKERDKFESVSQANVPAPLDFSKYDNGTYKNYALEAQFQGWMLCLQSIAKSGSPPTEQVAPPNKLSDEEIAITIGEICGYMRAHEITGNSHRKAIEVVRALVVKYAAAPTGAI